MMHRSFLIRMMFNQEKKDESFRIQSARKMLNSEFKFSNTYNIGLGNNFPTFMHA